METDKTGLCQLIEWWDNKNTFRMRQYSGIEVIDNARALLADEKAAMEKAQGQQDGLSELEILRKQVSHYKKRYIAVVDELSRHPQSVEAQKPINPVVAAHNEALEPLRKALWDMVEEMDENIEECPDYTITASCMVDDLRKALEKNPPEQKPTAPASLVKEIWEQVEIMQSGPRKARFIQILSGYQAEKSTHGQGDKGYWWCQKCENEVYSNHVTFGDYHADCGAKVKWIGEPQEPSPDPQTQVQQLIQWAKDNGYKLAAEWMVGMVEMTGKTVHDNPLGGFWVSDNSYCAGCVRNKK